MKQTEIKNELKKILSKINIQVISAWNDSLEDTTEAVILENCDKMAYNNWLKDLENLYNNISSPTTKEGEKYARKCDKCGKGMNEGYFANYKYFCSDKCLHTEYTKKEWEELASDGVEEDEGNDSYYWTEWEDTEEYQYQIINGELQEIE